MEPKTRDEVIRDRVDWDKSIMSPELAFPVLLEFYHKVLYCADNFNDADKPMALFEYVREARETLIGECVPVKDGRKESSEMEPAKFRVKPLVVEAVQWTGENFGDIAQLSENIFGPYGRGDAYLIIKGDRGRENVHLGNWVIKDANGVYYCSDEFFIKNYEPVFEGELNTEHTLEEDFEHFLAYSKLELTDKDVDTLNLMRRAFEAARNGTLR